MKKNISETDIINQSVELFDKVSSLIDGVKRKLAISFQSELALLYWHVGCQINEFVLHNERAPYGKQIIKNLSKKLIEKYGSGWAINISDIVYAVRRLFQKNKLSTH